MTSKVMSSTTDNQVTNRFWRWRQVASAASLVIFTLISLCLWLQPDPFAALVLVPPWCWLILGLMLCLCAHRRKRRAFTILLLALWSLFTVLFVEEAWSLVRPSTSSAEKWQASRERGRGVRVVSLNCGTGDSKSVRQVAAWNPDIVLLQESPSEKRPPRQASRTSATGSGDRRDNPKGLGNGLPDCWR